MFYRTYYFLFFVIAAKSGVVKNQGNTSTNTESPTQTPEVTELVWSHETRRVIDNDEQNITGGQRTVKTVANTRPKTYVNAGDRFLIRRDNVTSIIYPKTMQNAAQNNTRNISDRAETSDNFKIYFGSKDERFPLKNTSRPEVTVKISSEITSATDDGKLYFEPTSSDKKKHVNTEHRKKNDSNIMKIEPKQDKNIDTNITTDEPDTLDNRYAFNADVPCKAGFARVNGECVETE